MATRRERELAEYDRLHAKYGNRRSTGRARSRPAENDDDDQDDDGGEVYVFRGTRAAQFLDWMTGKDTANGNGRRDQDDDDDQDDEGEPDAVPRSHGFFNRGRR